MMIQKNRRRCPLLMMMVENNTINEIKRYKCPNDCEKPFGHFLMPQTRQKLSF